MDILPCEGALTKWWLFWRSVQHYVFRPAVQGLVIQGRLKTDPTVTGTGSLPMR
jgi:hypothetical protein